MFKSKSKKIGFFGTFLFHGLLFLICLYSSIAYTSVPEPFGIEIHYRPIEEVIVENENLKQNEQQELDVVDLDVENNVEELIEDNTQMISMPIDKDTISIDDVEIVENPIISSRLEEALLKLNTQVEDTLSISSNTEQIEDVKNLDFNNPDGYVLSENRFAVVKVKPDYKCEESGKVIVRVWVNREGHTIKAEPGIRGTTESASCLLEEAKIAALKTTWTPYIDAPDIQIGQITYNFHRN